MISVGIIDNHDEQRTELTHHLNNSDNIRVIFSEADPQNIAFLLSTSPDVIIMDPDFKSSSCTNDIYMLRQSMDKVKIIILTECSDDEKIFNCLKVGANGFLLKDTPFRMISDAVISVHNGEAVIDGCIANKILGYFNHENDKFQDLEFYHLTHREKEILMLLMDGLSYKEISAACFISIDTLNSHIRHIYAKLHVRSRSEIAARFR
jgi:two-component system, NarL family, response regulator LiaR